MRAIRARETSRANRERLERPSLRLAIAGLSFRYKGVTGDTLDFLEIQRNVNHLKPAPPDVLAMFFE
jgi:hypothetical protein